MTLLEKVASKKNLEKAWGKIKRKPNSFGSDKVTIEDFKNNLKQNLQQIRVNLLSGAYNFEPLRGVVIGKKGKAQNDPKNKRPLSIPAVKDRVVQKAIAIVIQSLLEKKYKIKNPASFAYVEERGFRDVAKEIKKQFNAGFEFVYKGDIEKFFDTINFDKLMVMVESALKGDTSLNALIRNALTAEISNKTELESRGYYDLFVRKDGGIPQGSVLSPLFANVYLSGFDHKMRTRTMKLVRYADDFLVMCKTEGVARLAHCAVQEIIEGDLGLKLHPLDETGDAHSKSRIASLQNINFIGLNFSGASVFPDDEELAKRCALLQQLHRDYKDDTIISVLNKVNHQITGWAAYYYFTDITDAQIRSVDEALQSGIPRYFRVAGVELKASKGFKIMQLNKIGIHSFRQSIQRLRRKADMVS